MVDKDFLARQEAQQQIQQQQAQPIQDSSTSNGITDAISSLIPDTDLGIVEAVADGASAALEKVGDMAESASELVSDAAEAVGSFIAGIFD